LDGDTGIYRSAANVIQLVSGAQARVQVDGNFAIKNDAGGGVFQVVPASNYINMFSSILRNTAGAVGAPSVTFAGDLNTGMYQVSADQLGLVAGGSAGGVIELASSNVEFKVNSVQQFQVDNNATARNTRMLIYDVDNATMERVSVGVADSGGGGFKLLRIPN